MCRLAAYIGPELTLQDFLLQPEHGLMHQSWAPEEMAEARLNADGFGFAWYGDQALPRRYTNTCPIWADPNLHDLAASLSSSTWFANVRSATPGQSVHQDNTQPFFNNGLLFMHNGFITNFDQHARARFHEYLQPRFQAGIQGNTDSEYLFAVLQQCCHLHDDALLPGFRQTVAELPDLLDGAVTLFNIVVSNGQQVLVCRHAYNGGNCPTLYYSNANDAFPGATLIASERFSQTPDWRAVEPHCQIVMDKRGIGRCEPL